MLQVSSSRRLSTLTVKEPERDEAPEEQQEAQESQDLEETEAPQEPREPDELPMTRSRRSRGQPQEQEETEEAEETEEPQEPEQPHEPQRPQESQASETGELFTGATGPQTAPNLYRKEPGVGGWGGFCTCPDGLRYEVGDNMNACASLACDGGQAGSCTKHAYVRLSSRGMRVTCKTESRENVYQREVGVGMWGGSCTCPDGQVYEVGDYMNDCKSLACVGGVAGECHKHGGQTSFGMKVTCASSSSDVGAGDDPPVLPLAPPSAPRPEGPPSTSAKPAPVEPTGAPSEWDDYVHDG